MKKTMLMAVLLVLTVSAVAQSPFREGKWFINPSITGFDLSYSKNTKMHLGLDLQAGAFIIDDFALIVGLGAEAEKDYNRYSAGVGARYYFSSTGFFVGAGFDLSRYSIHKAKNTYFDVKTEVGYAFFLNKNITLEPSVYYKWNTKDSDLSKFGLKIGFAMYFH